MANPIPPKETFGKTVAKGMGYGALALGMVTADDGNMLVNGAVGAGVGATVAAVHSLREHLRYSNATVRRNKRAEEVRQRHSALRADQFDK